MQAALNSYLGPHGAYYAPQALSQSPTSSQKSTFRSRVVSNAHNGWGIAGDAEEEVGSPHLVGHPSQLIYHWFAIRGYSSYGVNTNYMDPAASPYVSWGVACLSTPASAQTRWR
jgi:hypothetical protein